jgi:hypothetical protein
VFPGICAHNETTKNQINRPSMLQEATKAKEGRKNKINLKKEAKPQ